MNLSMSLRILPISLLDTSGVGGRRRCWKDQWLVLSCAPNPHVISSHARHPRARIAFMFFNVTTGETAFIPQMPIAHKHSPSGDCLPPNPLTVWPFLCYFSAKFALRMSYGLNQHVLVLNRL